MPATYGFLSSSQQLSEDIRNEATLEYFMHDCDFIRVIENRTDGTIRFRKGKQICECRADNKSALNDAKEFAVSLEEGKHINVMDKFISKLESGSVLMFSTVTDLSYRAETALYLYRKMNSEGIIIQFLKEPWLNNNIYKSVQRNCAEIDGVIQSVLRATYERIDYKNSYIGLLCNTETNEAKKNVQEKLSEQS